MTDLVSFEAVLAWVAQAIPAASVIEQPALNRVLAAPVTAPYALPPCPMALMDGIALMAAATNGASEYAPARVPGRPVMAAASLRPDEDAVVPASWVDMADGTASVTSPVACGTGRLDTGAIVVAGAEALAAGTLLGPPCLGLLAALGLGRVALVRQPRVAVLGDSPLLAACIVQDGGIVEHLPGPDDHGLSWARAGGFDLILTHSPAPGVAFTRGLPIAPGAAAGFGMIDGVPAVLVPPGLEDALATYRLLARPILRRAAGLPMPSTTARLTTALSSPLGIAMLVWIRVADGVAIPAGPGLMAATTADGHVLIPPNSEGLPAGATVTVWT